MILNIGCIVEGKGEIQALPTVIRRIAVEFDPTIVVQTPYPVRMPANRLTKEDEPYLERAIGLLCQKMPHPGAILIVLDCDDGCPATEGPELLRRAVAIRSDVPIGVVLAKREFEAWFLASAISLRGKRGLADDLDPPDDPESIRGAKGWLRSRMPQNRTYAPTLDQPALAGIFDMNMARRGSDSFDKCYREVVRLLEEMVLGDIP